jgi:hypothetical protein
MSKKKKRGRPTKFTASTRRKILANIRRGLPLNHCCVAAGITFQSLCTYRDSDPAFADAIMRATSRGIESRLGIVSRAMRSKDESVRLRAATWWLTHAPAAAPHFSETRRVEMDGQPPVIAPTVIFALPEKIPLPTDGGEYRGKELPAPSG